MSYDITGTVTESCQTEQAGSVTGTFAYDCSTFTAGEIQGTIQWGCSTFTAGGVEGTIQWGCTTHTSGGIQGTIQWGCDTRTSAIITAEGDGSSFVFEEGRAVLTGRPRENDFVYIEDPSSGDEKLVRTYGDDSILAFIEGDGVVSLPVDDS